MSKDYMGVAEWAAAAGYTAGRVRNWTYKAEPPEPDVTIGGQYRGWDRARLPELVAWCREMHDSLDVRAINRRYGIRRSGEVHGAPEDA